MTMRIVAAIAALATGLLVFACGGGSGNDTPEPSPAATQTAPAGETPGTPGETTTGIRIVDDLIAALAASNADAIVSQLVYTGVECQATPVPLYGVPPCGDEPEGSLVDAFPIAQCEGDNFLPEQAQSGVRQTLRERPQPEVYGVYRVGDSNFHEGFFGRASPAYAVVLASDVSGTTWGWAFLLNDEGVTGLSTGCAQPPDEYVSAWELTDSVEGGG